MRHGRIHRQHKVKVRDQSRGLGKIGQSRSEFGQSGFSRAGANLEAHAPVAA
jgi:hypothetical protein